MAPLMGPFLPRRQWREGESNREGVTDAGHSWRDGRWACSDTSALSCGRTSASVRATQAGRRGREHRRCGGAGRGAQARRSARLAGTARAALASAWARGMSGGLSPWRARLPSAQREREK
jgi:hypothetical protein